MELIDTSIVNVALNQMAGNLGASIEDIAWVITSYAIANVIIIPMTGFLAAYFGRRRYYMASIIIFSSIWGLALHEWKGASPKAKRLLFLGLAVLVASTFVVGYGNLLGSKM